jgi:hypothetical protein
LPIGRANGCRCFENPLPCAFRYWP